MPSQTRKPQYRTLVKALDDLAFGALDVLDGNEDAGTLAQRNKRLRKAAMNGLDLIARAGAVLAEKARRKDGDRSTVEGERTAALPQDRPEVRGSVEGG